MAADAMIGAWSRRALLFVFLPCALVAGGPLVFVAQASATTTYMQSALASLRPTPTSVAVDNSHGSSAGIVYVVDDEKVQEFDAAGDFVRQFAAPGVERIVVDNSNTSSAGDLYLLIPDNGGSDGAIDRLSQNGGASGPWITGLETPSGVAIDAEGNIYVAQSSGGVLEFSPEGTPLNEGKPIVTGLNDPQGVAVDSHGDLYVADDSVMGTVEFTPAGGGGFSAAKTIDPAAALDVAVDPATEDVYVASGATVEVFDAAGSLMGVALGSQNLMPGTYDSVAESQSTGDIYATNTTVDELESAEAEEPPEAPITEACAGPLTPGVQQLCGTLNPVAGGRVGYYFEFNKGMSCDGGSTTSAGAEVTGTDVAVSSEVTGLEPNTQYTDCLVATNPYGGTPGQDLTFTTQEEAPATTTTTSTSTSTSTSAGATTTSTTTTTTTTSTTAVVSSTSTTQSASGNGAGTFVITPPPLRLDTHAKTLTLAQKLTKALKACAKKPRRQRAGCERQARVKYGVRSAGKKGRQPGKKSRKG